MRGGQVHGILFRVNSSSRRWQSVDGLVVGPTSHWNVVSIHSSHRLSRKWLPSHSMMIHGHVVAGIMVIGHLISDVGCKVTFGCNQAKIEDKTGSLCRQQLSDAEAVVSDRCVGIALCCYIRRLRNIPAYIFSCTFQTQRSGSSGQSGKNYYSINVEQVRNAQICVLSHIQFINNQTSSFGEACAVRLNVRICVSQSFFGCSRRA